MVCLTQNAKTAYSNFFCADQSAQREIAHVNQNPAKGLRQSIYDAALDLRVCGGAQVLTEYVNGNESQSYVYASYVDEPIALVKANGDASFYHQDHLFSVEVMTDDVGSLIETYDYNGYGKLTIKNASGTVRTTSAVGNSYYFTGRRLDDESRLHYFRARYFDVALSRFIGRDPITQKLKIGSDDLTYKFRPSSNDGYQDGMGLYAGYFVTRGMDPFGTKTTYCLGSIFAGHHSSFRSWWEKERKGFEKGGPQERFQDRSNYRNYCGVSFGVVSCFPGGPNDFINEGSNHPGNGHGFDEWDRTRTHPTKDFLDKDNALAFSKIKDAIMASLADARKKVCKPCCTHYRIKLECGRDVRQAFVEATNENVGNWFTAISRV